MRKVVVTGLGVISPLGIGTADNWNALTGGKSGIGPITRFDTSAHPTKIAGEVRGFDPEAYMDHKEARRMDLFVQYAVAAARMALLDAGWIRAGAERLPEAIQERTACIVGSGIGGIATLEDGHSTLLARGPKRISPFFIPSLIVNLAPGHISIMFQAKGPSWSPVSACATGAHAVGEAAKLIERGAADVAICGGAEAPITPLGIAGFNALRALSTRNDQPQRASRPFDKDRDGFVSAEGAGVLVLEAEETALKRGAKIYAVMAGYGLNSDAHHITAPSPEGAGAARCMKLALEDARIAPEQIGYINAHGTSTPYNDANETMAIKTVFGEHARRLAISSTKSMTGHMLGAAGGAEAVYSVLALHRGALPPTINQETPDPECDLDYVPNAARPAEVEAALSNSFGFGGTNAVLVFSRWRDPSTLRPFDPSTSSGLRVSGEET